MKSRQLGIVLIALIVVGIAGLIFRVVASGSDEIVLEGLIHVGPDSTDRVLIEGDGNQAELVRQGDAGEYNWFVDNQPVFARVMDQFWQAVSDLYEAQLVSTNPVNHQRMGVVDGESIEVSFFQGRRSLQEKLIIGTWKPDVRLCYIRRSGHVETHGIPCPIGNVFSPVSDNWKNPVITAIPPNEIQEVQFTYADGGEIREEFALRPNEDGEWMVTSSDGTEAPASPFAVNSILGSLQIVVASGFATEEETESLNFALPDAMVRVLTYDEAPTPSTRLRLLRKDDQSMYLRVPSTGTVYIVDSRVLGPLLLELDQVTDGPPGG